MLAIVAGINRRVRINPVRGLTAFDPMPSVQEQLADACLAGARHVNAGVVASHGWPHRRDLMRLQRIQRLVIEGTTVLNQFAEKLAA